MSNQKNKEIKKSSKRVNKTKEEIINQIHAQQRIDHAKEVVRRVFPHLSECETIYDGQTVVNALAGFIRPHIENYLSKIKLSDLPILESITNEEDTPIKRSLVALLEELKDEPAKQVSTTLEGLGQAFSAHGATKFLKQPMSELTVDELVSK